MRCNEHNCALLFNSIFVVISDLITLSLLTHSTADVSQGGKPYINRHAHARLITMLTNTLSITNTVNAFLTKNFNRLIINY